MTEMTVETEAGHCDLCNSETGVCWAWETPSEASSVDEALENGTFWAEDPIWHVCDTCHRIILADKQDALLMRALSLIDRNKIWLSPDEQGVYGLLDIEERMGQVHRMFWKFKTSYKEL